MEAETTAEDQQKRVIGVPFPKGVSGNPEGRPKGVRNMTTKVREALEKIAEGKDYTYEEAFIKSIMKKAIVDGDSQIIRLIWNYLDGMPLQKNELTGDFNLNLNFNEQGYKPKISAERLPDRDADGGQKI